MNLFIKTLLEQKVTSDLATRLEQHWKLLLAWNSRTNLTAITDDVQAAYFHYLDSLAIVPLLPEGDLVDFGSGGGFPGMVIALAQPNRSVTLMEPKRKKVSFLKTAALRLNLPNVRVIQASHSDPPTSRFTVGVTRATFSDPNDLQACLTWLKNTGQLVAMRASADADPKKIMHHYSICGETRVVEVYQAT